MPVWCTAGFVMAQPPKHFKPEPYAYHEEVELHVERLTNLGHGVGRDNGWVVMVPFALPGERVRARIWANRAKHSEADLVAVLTPSPERVEPACPLFTQCGGCQYQHLRYAGQLQWKREQVGELLARIGGLPEVPVNEPVGSPELYAYRSKLTPHHPKPPADLAKMPLGFLQAGPGRMIVDVPHCPIATAGVNEAMPWARRQLYELLEDKRAKGRKLRGGTVLLREHDGGVTTDNGAVVAQTVGARTYRFIAGEFFQNNPFILPLMLDYVLGEAGRDGLPYLVDVYCGVGAFTLWQPERFTTVTGIEIAGKAIELARENAERNQVANAIFYEGNAEAIFAYVRSKPKETALILDPPRRGCDELFLRQLLAFGPARVVYVSCDPATQARDARILVDGGYRVEAVQPFDLFPQTRHIENVMTFSRAD